MGSALSVRIEYCEGICSEKVGEDVVVVSGVLVVEVEVVVGLSSLLVVVVVAVPP